MIDLDLFLIMPEQSLEEIFEKINQDHSRNILTQVELEDVTLNEELEATKPTFRNGTPFDSRSSDICFSGDVQKYYDNTDEYIMGCDLDPQKDITIIYKDIMQTEDNMRTIVHKASEDSPQTLTVCDEFVQDLASSDDGQAFFDSTITDIHCAGFNDCLYCEECFEVSEEVCHWD